MWIGHRVVAIATSFATLCVAEAHAAAADCSADALSALKVMQFAVTSATRVAAVGPLPAHCNVKGKVTTDGEGAGPSSARVEINLPDDWNGKIRLLRRRGTRRIAHAIRQSP